MSELSPRQATFLMAMHDEGKPVKALMRDMGISPRELREWLEEEAFNAAKQDVDLSLSFCREQDIRIGAAEAVRRSRDGSVDGEARYLNPRHQRKCRQLVELARSLDRKFPTRWTAPGARGAIDPVPPKFRQIAVELAERIIELRQMGIEPPPGMLEKEEK